MDYDREYYKRRIQLMNPQKPARIASLTRLHLDSSFHPIPKLAPMKKFTLSNDWKLYIPEPVNAPPSKITRSWPRPPDGRPIIPASSTLNTQAFREAYARTTSEIIPPSRRGKQAPNGIHSWGHSLADFYHVVRSPATDMSQATIVMSGSELAKWAKAYGELDSASEEIARAEREPDPKKIKLIPPGRFLELQEARVRAGEWGKTMKSVETMLIDLDAIAVSNLISHNPRIF